MDEAESSSEISFPRDLFPILHSHVDLPLTQHKLEHAFKFPIHGIGQLSLPKINLFLHKKQFFDPLSGEIILPIGSTKRYKLSRTTISNMGYEYRRRTYNVHPFFSWDLDERYPVSPTDIMELQHYIDDKWTTISRLYHRVIIPLPWIEGTIEVYQTWVLSNDKENPVIVFHVWDRAVEYFSTQKYHFA